MMIPFEKKEADYKKLFEKLLDGMVEDLILCGRDLYLSIVDYKDYEQSKPKSVTWYLENGVTVIIGLDHKLEMATILSITIDTKESTAKAYVLQMVNG